MANLGIYKPEQVEEGWQIFYHYPKGSHLGDVKRPVEPIQKYTKRQAAYRRSKDLNDRRASSNIGTIYVKIITERQYCPALVKKLMEMIPQYGITVHDPLDREDDQRRYITCGRLCRYREDDFDPNTPEFVKQPPTEEDFYTFIQQVRSMSGVYDLETSSHSYQIYPREE